METFKPNRWLGMASGFILGLLVLSLDGVLLWGIIQTGISLRGFFLFLVIIVIWLQGGYSMTLFSAALKGVPQELLEVAGHGRECPAENILSADSQNFPCCLVHTFYHH